MEEQEIRERLAKAEVTRDTLEKQFKISQVETTRLSILTVKWAGIADYFKSLLPETMKLGPNKVVPFKIISMKKGTEN